MTEHKGFEASEKKKKKAIKDGKSLKVPYLYQVLYFSSLILTTYIFIKNNFTDQSENIKQCVINPFNMIESCLEFYGRSLMLFCFAPMALSLVFVLAIMFYHNRECIFVWSLAKFDFKKVNAVSGIINLFSSLKDSFIIFIKLFLLGIILMCFLVNNTEIFINIFFEGFNLSIIKDFFMVSIVAFLIGAFIEYIIKKKRHLAELSMSRDDLKREMKEDEGDPQIKSKRRFLHESILMQKIEEKVKNSKVIIVD